MATPTTETGWPEFYGELVEYQQEDVELIIDGSRPAYLDANDMGLGKTYEAIAADIGRRQLDLIGPGSDQHTLVVCPKNAITVWERHYRDLTNLSYLTLAPTSHANLAKKADVYIVTWDWLARIQGFDKMQWFYVIADECHRAGHWQTKRAIALRAINTKYKLGLSGTPIQDKPQDYYGVLLWLYPERWAPKGYWGYMRQFVDMEKSDDGYFIINGPKNTETLRRITRGYVLRHTKRGPCCKQHPDGVLSMLPPRSVRWADDLRLTAEQRKQYKSMAKNMLIWFDQLPDEFDVLMAASAGAKFTRLRQIADAAIDADGKCVGPSSKVDWVLDWLSDSTRAQVVLFSEFKSMVSLTTDSLRKAGYTAGVITGDTAHGARSHQVDAFQAGDLQAIVISTRAGSEAITLTAADTVIMIDRDANPNINEQAISRVDRFGQANPVQVIHLYIPHTVDSRVIANTTNKQEWMDAILEYKEGI